MKYLKFFFLPVILLMMSSDSSIAQAIASGDSSEVWQLSKEQIESLQPVKMQQALADTNVYITPVEPFPGGEGFGAIFSWFMANWNRLIGNITLLILLLESILSVIPTAKNWSIFQKLRELFDRLILFRNNRSGGGIFVARSEVKEGADKSH